MKCCSGWQIAKKTAGHDPPYKSGSPCIGLAIQRRASGYTAGMRFSQLIVLWLVVSLAVIRVMGVHVHVHSHAQGQPTEVSAVDVHTFDAGIHSEHADDHVQAHLDHGDRDVNGPGEVGKWPKFGWNLALLLVSLALLWLIAPGIVRLQPQPIAARPRRPSDFLPPSQAPPLFA
jgi:hypothetical protein